MARHFLQSVPDILRTDLVFRLLKFWSLGAVLGNYLSKFEEELGVRGAHGRAIDQVRGLEIHVLVYVARHFGRWERGRWWECWAGLFGWRGRWHEAAEDARHFVHCRSVRWLSLGAKES